MTEKNKSGLQKNLLIIMTLLAVIICGIELKEIYWGGLNRDIYFNPFSTSLFIIFLVIICIPFGLLFWHFFIGRDTSDLVQKYPFFQGFIFILLGIFPSVFLQFSGWGNIIHSGFLRILLFACTTFLMTYNIVGKKIFSFDIHHFYPALVFLAACLLLSNRIKLIVDYPFSLSWSEGNRFWDYSLLFWKDHYQIADGSTIAAFLDLGRQSLWGLAFLWKNLTIAGMRAWNTILYFLPPLLLGLLVFKHKKIKFPILLTYEIWTYIFLSEGPIYAPLIFCAILVLLAAEIRFFPASLILIALAGYYANMTRFTWIIAPTVWAFLLIYFREKVSLPKQRNLKSVLAALAGLIGGFILPNFLSIQNSPIILEENTSSGILQSITNILRSQDLLWYRLLPSETFPLGILPALFLIVTPLFIIVSIYIKKEKIQLEKAEKFYLIASIIGFLLVGSVVSVKIGGGSNLHNMDMFLITLLIMISIFWKNGLAEWFHSELKKTGWVSILVLFLLVYPSIRHIYSVKPLSLPSDEIITNSLASIQDAIDEKKDTGEILFIDQRQLLTFGKIKNVNLIGEYEKKLLMNEALSNNQAYFNLFYGDLKEHRFALIISEPTRIIYQSDENNFGEENDAYVKWVSEPLLCYYEPLETFQEVGVELLVPRTSPLPENLNCP
jgi:hypothetical protein